MPCPPLHINRLSLDNNGWIIQEDIANKDDEDGGVRNVVEIERPVTPKCQRLLNATHLSLSSDLFRITGNGATAHAKTNDIGNGGIVIVDTLDTKCCCLSHAPNLVDTILSTIEEIRQMGRESKRSKGGSEDQQRGNRGRPSRRNGKVASLEEQRRLRQQNEQKKLLSEQQVMQDGDDGGEAPDQEKEDEQVALENNDGEIVPINGDDSDPNPVKEALLDVPDLRLAAVFNSIRVVIDITRPILDHPKCQDLGIKMKNGPSIKKDGVKDRYYLLSKNVYSCANSNAWRRLKSSYSNLLEELEVGLTARMSKQLGAGVYELTAKEWVANLFNHELYLNKEHVANKCMELPTLNPVVSSKINAALIDRFDHDRDGMQSLLKGAINKLHQHLTNAISRRFNGARLTVYGSCLSGLALEGSHDVDISIHIPQVVAFKKDFDEGNMSAQEYEKKMRRTIFNVRDCLQNYRSEQFSNLFAVTRARVPVIKGSMNAQNPHTPDGSLSFDLCFLNEIAVVNSSLLKEYSLFDKNVRLLMLAVKSFAKMNGIASAADGTLSSYSWLNLVVFYLQCTDMVPVLTCPKLMESHQLRYDPTNPWHSINGLQTFYLTKDKVAGMNIWQRASHEIHTSPAMLLYGFFNFYSAIFPQQIVAASIRFGEMSLPKTCLGQSSKLWRICVEDPFETCDSHCPHDLGCHVLEHGQKKITKCLKQAKKMMESVLRNKSASDIDISNLLSKLLGSTKSKTMSAKGSVGNQNEPIGRNQRGETKHEHVPQNRARQESIVRQSHEAVDSRILPHVQNGKLAPHTNNGTSEPNHSAGSGKSATKAQNTRIVPNTQNGRIVPNALNRQHGGTNNNAQSPVDEGKKITGVKYQLFVGNLPWNTTWQELKDYFRQVGEVERSTISKNRSGRSLGVGYIHYYSDEDAKHAFAKLNGVEFMGRPLKIRLGVYVPRS